MCISNYAYYYTIRIINKEYFQDEAFWFEVSLDILFLNVPEKHLAGEGEWDRAALLQAFLPSA